MCGCVGVCLCVCVCVCFCFWGLHVIRVLILNFVVVVVVVVVVFMEVVGKGVMKGARGEKKTRRREGGCGGDGGKDVVFLSLLLLRVHVLRRVCFVLYISGRWSLRL